jgi:hypothetical protein
MNWFEHRTDARNNKKIRKIERHYGGGDAGMAAVGRYWRLLEIVAEQSEDHNFVLPEGYDLELLAEDLKTNLDYLADYFNLLASIDAIDPEHWAAGRIACPKLLDRASEYVKKKISKDVNISTKTAKTADNIPTVSGQCPDNIPTVSGQCRSVPDQTRPDITKKPPHTPPGGLAEGLNGRKIEFEECFWPNYPRKVGKPKAKAAYLKLLRLGRLPPWPVIQAALNHQKTWPQWGRDNGQFIPHPTTWLQREGWNDKPAESQAKGSLDEWISQSSANL